MDLLQQVQKESARPPQRPQKIKVAVEQTLIVVKPDGFKRQLAGKILARFEEKGFQIKQLKTYNFTKEKAQDFYSVHKEKPFFGELVSFISSGTVVACILEGNNAVNTVRLMIGATKSFEAAPGTIRGDFGLGITDNIIHASDSAESFNKESGVIFS
jgi:nucleoside-diphosphate kinase